MNVVIIDDEQSARNSLIDKLNRFCLDMKIVAVVDSAESGYNAILEHSPDLVFLDIAMPVESGFDLLNKFDEIEFEIIFITGFDRYAINAIEFSAIGYVLKPINIEELIKAVHNAKKRYNIKTENTRISNLLTNMKNTNPSAHKIAIPSVSGLEYVKTSDIIRFEGYQKLSKIFLTENRKLISSYNIGEFRKLLNDYGFYSPHKSHFINKEHIKKYLKEGTIIMSDNSTVPISKRRKSEFISIMKLN